MVFGISTWASIATISLIYLTYQDHKNKMIIDDKKNLYMWGFTFALVLFLNTKVWYILVLVFSSVLLSKFIVSYKLLGDGDASTLSWLIFGLGAIDIFSLLLYSGIFILCTIFWHICKFYIFKIKGKSPFYMVILVTFVANAFLMQLY